MSASLVSDAEIAEVPKKKFFNPLKRAMKTASKVKKRITAMFSSAFKKKEEPVDLTITEGEDDEDNRPISQLEVGILRTFSPFMVHHQIYRSKNNAKLQPSCSIHFGAVLFADISGFTRLANLLSVEQLQIHISNYFTMMFECVEQFGGDILKICGDAIMIMWPLERDSEDSTEEEKAACALTASLCGRELLISCGLYRTYHGDTEVNLTLHCGVGVADIPCYWVGKSSRWEFLITGDVLIQISSTEPEAKSGEIIISPETYDLVKQHLAATVTPNGNYLLTQEIMVSNIGVESSTPSPSKKGFKALEYMEGLSDHPTLQFDKSRGVATKFLNMYDKSDPGSLKKLSDHPRMGNGLKYYVHSSARPRLQQMDHSMEFEMAELRDVVTLFVNIKGLEEDFRLQRLEMVQKVMSALVESHVSFGGTLRQFVVDDKGCVAIGSLGVPHYTFEDNCVRAVNIANMLRSKILSLGKSCNIGISAGSVFCGLVGSNRRREYAMMGSSVNLAARLMGSCPLGGIIVDERVRAAACDLLTFQDKGTIIAKGYADPVPIFAFYRSFRDAIVPDKESEGFGDKLVIGRKGQLDSLRLFLDHHVNDKAGSEYQFHFLEGEEGIGKSLIARQIAKEAKEMGVTVVLSTASESSCSTSYWLLANILEQFLTGHERRMKLMRELKQSKDSEEDDGSVPPLLALTGKQAAFKAFLVAKNSTAKFKDWITYLLSLPQARTVGLYNSLGIIMGHPVMDLVHLVGRVFKDGADDEMQLAIEHLNVDVTTQEQLLKALLKRALKAACENHQHFLVVDNLQWCDTESASTLMDFIGSSDKGFGIFCYRSTSSSRDIEHHTFTALRFACCCTNLPPLKVTEVSELAYHIIGPSQRSALTKEKLSRILSRTQGIPGLVESLVGAFRDELDKGLNPNIDDIRIPGQQSIVQKFDALDVNLQLLLKTAAAIGMIFSVCALRKIYDTLAFNALLSQYVPPVDKIRKGSIPDSGSGGSGSPMTTSPPKPRSGTLPGFTTGPQASSRLLTTAQSMHSAESMSSRNSSAQLTANSSVRFLSNAPGTPTGPDLSPVSARTQSTLPKSLTRLSSTFEMYQRNLIEADIEKLVALEMFSPHEFDGVKVPNPSSNGDDIDTPEIGIHAWPWYDARGLRRRGWAVISTDNDKGDKSRNSSFMTDASGDEPSPVVPPTPPSETPSPPRDVLNESQRGKRFYKFSHPSVQSTAYSLSLQLDRVPVHAATIEYLTSSFNISPGVEEACLYHSMHLNNSEEILFWLFKCTVVADKTMRYRLFIQRAIQLLSALAKAEQSSGEPEDHIFQILGQYIERQGVLLPGVQPSVYPYTFEDRVSPHWVGTEGKRSRNNCWLFSIGCIMRDVVFAMVTTGDFRLVLSLHILSHRMLSNVVRRTPRVPESTNEYVKRRASSLLVVAERSLPLPLDALEVDSESDTSSEGDELLTLVPPDENTITLLTHRASVASMDTPRFLNGCDETPSQRGSISFFQFDPPVSIPIDLRNYAQRLVEEGTFAEYVVATHVMAYVRGQEALALWNIMRGDSVTAMSFISDAISVIQNSDADCDILYAICFARLLALKSICLPLSLPTSSIEGTKCLDDAQLWIDKSQEKEVAGSVKHFYEAARPRLEGLRALNLHKDDSGEWVVITVRAMGLCGVGEWDKATKCFLSAEDELKCVNDKASLFHVKVLQAWSMFLTGDLLTFKSTMQSITSHVRQSDERLVRTTSGTLQAIRLSLSCFYDAAETLLINLVQASTPTPISTPRSLVAPRASIRSPSKTSPPDSLNMAMSMAGPSEMGENIFLRIAEAFLVSKRRPKELPLIDITIICAKISIRTPGTYIGGVYLFFAAIAALAVYDDATSIGGLNREDSDATSLHRFSVDGNDDGDGDDGSESSDEEPKTPDTNYSLFRVSKNAGELESLLESIETVVDALALLSTRHTVLVYMSRAISAHYLRLRGRLPEALQCAAFNPPSNPVADPVAADTSPLGVAYLKMESAMCQLASHDASWSDDQIRENLESTISSANESIELFELFGADIEINILKRCVSDSEDLLEDLLSDLMEE